MSVIYSAKHNQRRYHANTRESGVCPPDQLAEMLRD